MPTISDGANSDYTLAGTQPTSMAVVNICASSRLVACGLLSCCGLDIAVQPGEMLRACKQHDKQIGAPIHW